MELMLDLFIQQGQIYFTRLNQWKNKTDLYIEAGPYTLQMARTKKEVLECFKLRHEVFCVEMAENPRPSKLDFDKYDNFCDHLIIKHEPTGKIVGTYRMNYSETSDLFYTESEFEISGWIAAQKSPFIELGRACIEKKHRRGAVITLLWRGIAEYMKSMKAEKLIGCTSIKVTDARSAALIYKYFEVTGALSEEVFKPKDNFQMKDLLFWLMVFTKGLSANQMAEAEEKIPSLLKSYLRAGAKVSSYPAYDAEFKCIDFATVMVRSEMDGRLARKLTS